MAAVVEVIAAAAAEESVNLPERTADLTIETAMRLVRKYSGRQRAAHTAKTAKAVV